MIRREPWKTSAIVELLSAWRPNLPAGRIDALYLHWSGDDYERVFPAYHFCIGMMRGEIVVTQTHDLRANMREVSGDGYAAHTFGRNSFAAGIAIMGMRDATPGDFGDYPLTVALIDGLARVGGAIVRAYAIPLDATHVLTHAEAAITDGYFGTATEERWDIARLTPNPTPLTRDDATRTGNILRSQIAASV